MWGCDRKGESPARVLRVAGLPCGVWGVCACSWGRVGLVAVRLVPGVINGLKRFAPAVALGGRAS